jgi:hypothetical protein
MLADPSTSVIAERFGERAWQKSIELFGHPPTWNLNHSQILLLLNELETEN